MPCEGAAWPTRPREEGPLLLRSVTARHEAFARRVAEPGFTEHLFEP